MGVWNYKIEISQINVIVIRFCQHYYVLGISWNVWLHYDWSNERWRFQLLYDISQSMRIYIEKWIETKDKRKARMQYCKARKVEIFKHPTHFVILHSPQKRKVKLIWRCFFTITLKSHLATWWYKIFNDFYITVLFPVHTTISSRGFVRVVNQFHWNILVGVVYSSKIISDCMQLEMLIFWLDFRHKY